MNKSCKLLILGLLISTCTFAQKKLQLHDYKFSEDIKSELAAGKIRASRAAYYSTYIGDYQNAINYYELELDWGLDSISQIDSIIFLTYRPINAYEYLVEKVQSDSLVIISEAHQKPQH
ncbi:MAG: hypothetical protein AAF705_19585, partial [Bacteroidota bacterium]